MFRRFGGAARDLVAWAEEIAASQQEAAVGSVQVAAAACGALGLLGMPGAPGAAGTLPFETGALRILRDAFRRAVELGDPLVTPPHVLLAALESGDPAVHSFLRDQGIDPAEARLAALGALDTPIPRDEPGEPPASRPPPRPSPGTDLRRAAAVAAVLLALTLGLGDRIGPWFAQTTGGEGATADLRSAPAPPRRPTAPTPAPVADAGGATETAVVETDAPQTPILASAARTASRAGSPGPVAVGSPPVSVGVTDATPPPPATTSDPEPRSPGGVGHARHRGRHRGCGEGHLRHGDDTGRCVSPTRDGVADADDDGDDDDDDD